MLKSALIFISLFFFTADSIAQSLAINTDGSIANASALLDVKSTDKGLLIPRMSKTQRYSIATPAAGLLVFQNAPDSVGFYYYDGSKWNWMAAINGNADTIAWKMKGNANADTSTHFIGTTYNMPLRFKLNNTWAGQWDINKNNYYIGKDAGLKTTQTNGSDGRNNIAIGNQALTSNTTGYNNVANGNQALFFNTSGYHNIANGEHALYHNTTGIYNIVNGNDAMFFNIAGTHNIANGSNALYDNISGNHNVANGNDALFGNTTGSYNIASGYKALYFNSTGSNNIANGNKALNGNTTGSNNIALGDSSLLNSYVADNNVAIGKLALYNNSYGTESIAIGLNSLNSNTGGDRNISIGTNALGVNTDAGNNIAIGYNALSGLSRANSGSSFNTFNVAVGYSAMNAVNPDASGGSTGRRNTAVGANTLQVPVSGFNNTALGNNAEVNSATADNATALGANATATASNYVRIGNAGVTSIFGAVNFNTSDGRFKSNIQDDVPGLDFIMGLRPVTYHFEKAKYSQFIGEKQDKEYVAKLQQQDAENKVSTGFIAQEVDSLAEKLNYHFDGLYKPQNDKDAYGLAYQQFVTPLIKAVQEQQALIITQKEELSQLKALLQALEKRLALSEQK